MTRNLFIAFKKASQYSAKEWCGYLTPNEIVALVDEAGAKPVESNNHLLQRARGDIKTGTIYCTWFYFYPPTNWPIKARHDTLRS